jgi:glycine/D-amino acid oxidase-like deaminating enzyme
MAGPIVVVGSGIVGSAIAWQLQDRGVETILVERDVQPQGASYFSFASLSALDEPTSELYALKCLGMSHWRRWERELEGDIGLRWDGEIRWSETQQKAQLLRMKIDRAARRGYPVEELSHQQLTERLPNSRPSKVLAASFVPTDGQADPPKAIARLREAFERSGGSLLVGRASLRFDEDNTYVRVGSEELQATTVVVATGAETHSFLEKLGWDIPMEPSPGLLVLTEPTEPVLTGTVYVSPTTGPEIHMRQQSDGRVLIGEQSQEYVTKKPTMRHARELLRQAQRTFPSLSRTRIHQFTVEWRPMPRDHMPIVGPLPGVTSIYVATGHSGVTLAPAIAGLVAQELIYEEPALQLEQCRPARFVHRQIDLARDVEIAFRIPPEIYLG